MKRQAATCFVLVILAGVIWLGFGDSGRDADGKRSSAPPEQTKEDVMSSPEKGQTAVEEKVAKTSPNASQDQVPLLQISPLPLTAEEQAFMAGLRPRRLLPKEPLRIPEGEDLKLSVKWRDELGARADEEGRLVVRAEAGRDLKDVAQVLQRAEGLRFYRLHTVSDEKLSDLGRRAAERSGQAQPDLAGQVGVRLAGGGREAVVALARELHDLPEVEYAELESMDKPPPPPAVDIPPVTPLLEQNQFYRQLFGINVDFIWQRYGVRGDAGLRVTDCEYDYNPNHEDLAGLVTEQANVTSRYTAFGANHGTAVLGVLAAGRNAYGATGSVPDCATFFYPEYSVLSTGFQSRAACVTAAISDSAAGDIVVLEMQENGPGAGSSDYVPAEFLLSVWLAVRTGSDAGVITIAAAGNGNQNLDNANQFSIYQARGDSGAILVGAGDTVRAKMGFSTYGTRVNLQGWGTSVFTTGYGSYAQYGGDPNQGYTSTFSGTSSATPVVASAAALVQAFAIKVLGLRLSPGELRALLVETGQAQTGASAATAPIGPLPDIQMAVEALLEDHPPTFATYSSWGHFYFAEPEPDPWGDGDKDGWSNLSEYVAGTDPLQNKEEDQALRPRASVEAAEAGQTQWVFEFHQPAARTGVVWEVQFSPDLAEGSWLTLEDQVGGVSISRQGDEVRLTKPRSAATAAGFFRLRLTLAD